MKVAYVVLTGLDHPLCAFETTDKGIIYVDFAGPNPAKSAIKTERSGSIIFGEAPNYKKVAYVQVGKPVGFISLNVATLYGFDYQAYDTWSRNKADFYAAFNNLSQDRGYVQSLSKPLGGFWTQSDEKVSKIDLFWRGYSEPGPVTPPAKPYSLFSGTLFWFTGLIGLLCLGLTGCWYFIGFTQEQRQTIIDGKNGLTFEGFPKSGDTGEIHEAKRKIIDLARKNYGALKLDGITGALGLDSNTAKQCLKELNTRKEGDLYYFPAIERQYRKN